MVCLHVVFGLPLFLFPSGVHLRDTFVMSSDDLCRTWPSHQTYQSWKCVKFTTYGQTDTGHFWSEKLR
jgi:hypothetical protein